MFSSIIQFNNFIVQDIGYHGQATLHVLLSTSCVECEPLVEKRIFYKCIAIFNLKLVVLILEVVFSALFYMQLKL